MSTRERLPTYFIPHGGGPWPFMPAAPDVAAGNAAMERFLRGLLADSGPRPKAILVISGHWETEHPTVMDRPRNTMLFDYGGFPAHTYELTYAAPGSPELAARVRSLLDNAGFTTATERERGLDHGTFVPFMLVAPDADIPIVQLSLVDTLDPATHLAIGRALAPLRDEGVLIVGSGMSYHNMRGYFSGAPGAATFDAWLRETLTADVTTRSERLARWAEAPAARLAHPREEHLIPLMVAAGAAGDDRGIVAFNAKVLNADVSGFRFG